MHNASALWSLDSVLSWCRGASFLAVSLVLGGGQVDYCEVLMKNKASSSGYWNATKFKIGYLGPSDEVEFFTLKINGCRNPGNTINALPLNFLRFYFHNHFPSPVSNSMSKYETLAAFSFAALGHGRAQGVLICVHTCVWPECWHPGRKPFIHPSPSPDLQN